MPSRCGSGIGLIIWVRLACAICEKYDSPQDLAKLTMEVANANNLDLLILAKLPKKLLFVFRQTLLQRNPLLLTLGDAPIQH